MKTGTNLDLDGSISGAETSRTLITEGCSEHGSCELWAINGGSHGPSFNSNFPRELVDWLLEHRRPSSVPCVGDLDGNLVVDGADLSILLSAWEDTRGDYDLDGDGIVGGGDLSIVLGAWGDCPNG
jgi:hypothetical protein